jgi:hypothetical protein
MYVTPGPGLQVVRCGPKPSARQSTTAKVPRRKRHEIGGVDQIPLKPLTRPGITAVGCLRFGPVSKPSPGKMWVKLRRSDQGYGVLVQDLSEFRVVEQPPILAFIRQRSRLKKGAVR